MKNGDVAGLVPYGSYINASGDMAKLSVEQDKIVKVYDLRDTRS